MKLIPSLILITVALAGGHQAMAQADTQGYIDSSTRNASSSRINGRPNDALLIALSAIREWGPAPSLLREQGLACEQLRRHRCHAQVETLLRDAASGGDHVAAAWLAERGIQAPKIQAAASLRVGQVVSIAHHDHWQTLPGTSHGMHGDQLWTSHGFDNSGDVRYFDLEGLGEFERFSLTCSTGEMQLLYVFGHSGSSSDGKSDLWEVVSAPRNETTPFDARNTTHRHLRQHLCGS